MSSLLPLAAGDLGAKALYFLILWLAGAIAAAYLSERKGYGEKLGLASGLVSLFLSPVVALIWLVLPARAGSAWKQDGPFGRRSRPTG